MSPVPQHVAVIMDGNGRWAQARGYTRLRGHREGARRVEEIVDACGELGVRYLTLFAFSTENWSRPRSEVAGIMRLIVQYLRRMEGRLIKNRVSLGLTGQWDRLPVEVREAYARVVKLTAFDDPAVHLNLCISYGGRQELVDAARKIAQAARDRDLNPDLLDETTFRQFLYRPEIPDPDLLIRTGGESRISNFLLWQVAYAELYWPNVHWPEFDREQFQLALREFGNRQRRFGLTGEQVTESKESIGVAP